MTGWYIRVGYNANFQREKVWEELKKVVKEIRENPTLKLISELRRVEELPEHCDLLLLRNAAEAYKETPDSDSTIKIVERIENDEEDFFIQQLSSGGGMEREIKDKLRRAFCRLVMQEMHKKGMEINITVG